MADDSGRFALPYLQLRQVQKELFHNEALTVIDALLHPVAQTIGDNAPPSTPAIGQGWIIGACPQGRGAGSRTRSHIGARAGGGSSRPHLG